MSSDQAAHSRRNNLRLALILAVVAVALYVGLQLRWGHLF